MASERLYHDDPYTTRFRARVAATGEHAGRPAVELEATCFYPEGGGQLGDRGTLGGARGRGRAGRPRTAASGTCWRARTRPRARWTPRWTGRGASTTCSSTPGSTSSRRPSSAWPARRPSPRRWERSTASSRWRWPAADWRLVERVEEAANRVVWEDRPVAAPLGGRRERRALPAAQGAGRGGAHPRRRDPGLGRLGLRRHARAAHRRGRRDQGRPLGEGARQRALRVPVRRPRPARPRLAHRGAGRGGAPAHAQGPRRSSRSSSAPPPSATSCGRACAALTARLIEAEARERVGVPPRAWPGSTRGVRARRCACSRSSRSRRGRRGWRSAAAAPDPFVMVGQGEAPRRGPADAAPGVAGARAGQGRRLARPRAGRGAGRRQGAGGVALGRRGRAPAQRRSHEDRDDGARHLDGAGAGVAGAGGHVGRGLLGRPRHGGLPRRGRLAAAGALQPRHARDALVAGAAVSASCASA